MENLIKNIKNGAVSNELTLSGFDLARHIADEHEKISGNKCVVRRVLDYVDQYEGRDREHYSFDVVEILMDGGKQ